MHLQNTSRIWCLLTSSQLPLWPQPRHLLLDLCSDPVSIHLLPDNPSATRSCSNITQITLLSFRLSKDFPSQSVKSALRSFVTWGCPLPTPFLFLWFLSPFVSPFQPSCMLSGLHPLSNLALVFVLHGTLFQDSYLAVPLSPLSLFECHVLSGLPWLPYLKLLPPPPCSLTPQSCSQVNFFSIILSTHSCCIT